MRFKEMSLTKKTTIICISVLIIINMITGMLIIKRVSGKLTQG